MSASLKKLSYRLTWVSGLQSSLPPFNPSCIVCALYSKR